MKAFFEEEGLARQHLDSYNDFVENDLQKIIDEVGEIQIDAPDYPFKVKLGRIEKHRPRIIEVDGSVHDTRKEYDDYRDNFLKGGKYTVLRFSNDEIENSIESVLLTIENCVSNLSKEDVSLI